MAYCVAQKLKFLIRKLSVVHWELGIVDGGISSILGRKYSVKWVKHSFKDRWFADPFILNVSEAAIDVLAEEFIYSEQKGKIVLLRIARDSMRVIERRLVLEAPTHLSFPAIYRHNDKVYVYPESSKSGKLVLYEIKDYQLTPIFTLSSNALTDAILTDLFGDLRIYSTCIPAPNGNELGLYKYDPEKKQFVLDRALLFQHKDARMAGDFFVYKGRIFKPSQDCSKAYGGAIRLYETVDGIVFNYYSTLTSPHPRLRKGMHTLNCYKDVAILDVKGYRYPIMGAIIAFLVNLKKSLN